MTNSLRLGPQAVALAKKNERTLKYFFYTVNFRRAYYLNVRRWYVNIVDTNEQKITGLEYDQNDNLIQIILLVNVSYLDNWHIFQWLKCFNEFCFWIFPNWLINDSLDLIHHQLVQSFFHDWKSNYAGSI